MNVEQLAILFNATLSEMLYVIKKYNFRWVEGKHYRLTEKGDRLWTERGGIDLAVLVGTPEAWALYDAYMDRVDALVTSVKELSEERK
mgnify:FL=1